MSFVRANAPITPSNEKLASSTWRYINAPNHHEITLVAACACSFAWRSELSADTPKKVTSPMILAVRKLAVSCAGNAGSLVTHRMIRSVIATHIDSSFHRFASCFSMDPIR